MSSFNGNWSRNIIDTELLEKFIILLLIETNIKNDRAYLDTIKRILEGNDRSKIASKYKSYPFYCRFPNITRWTLKYCIDKMIIEKKLRAFSGSNGSLYYEVDKNQISKIKDEEDNNITELLIRQIISG